MMTPYAAVRLSCALVGDERFRKYERFGVDVEMPVTWTVTVWLVTPGANVSRPDVAV